MSCRAECLLLDKETEGQSRRSRTSLQGPGSPRTACRDNEIAIAERFDGGSWRLETIPYPYSGSPHLTGVSCPNRLFCMAVGSESGSIQFFGTVAAKWTP